MDYLDHSNHAIRNLKSWIHFISQFPESVVEHKRRNNCQFSNVLRQLWDTESLLQSIIQQARNSPLGPYRPFLRELDDVIGKAIALVKEVYSSSEISPELYRSAEHCLEVFTELRWWTGVVLRCYCGQILGLRTFEGVSEPESSRLPRLVQKLYVWWSGSDRYLRHLPSYSIIQKDIPFSHFRWLADRGLLLRELDVRSMEYIIEGTVTVPALGAYKPLRVKDRKVDLTQVVLGVSHSALVVKCEDSGTNYALKRVSRSKQQEQPILARLAHPHVVCLLDFWRENGFLFLAMELMEGDLAELISRRLKKSKRPFTTDVAVDLMLQIAKTMLYLHDLGFTHPHLKSSDVLFREANDHVKLGENGVTPLYLLKLGDFRFYPKNDFKSMAQQNVYEFGLICVEILSTKPLYWRFEERIQGMSEKPSHCFDAVMRDLKLPQSLTKCIENCLDGTVQFSEVVTLLLLAQLNVLLHLRYNESELRLRKHHSFYDIVDDSEDESALRKQYSVYDIVDDSEDESLVPTYNSDDNEDKIFGSTIQMPTKTKLQ